jgi:hypothetical protein
MSCVGAVTGCVLAGSAIHPLGGAAVATPAQCAPPHALAGASATKYQSNCLLCALVGTAGIASTYHLPKADPEQLARTLARKTASADLQRAVHDGCIHGFHFAPKAKPSPPSPPAQANPPGPPAPFKPPVHGKK